jgi:tRNA pseudouridine32 synthase/23S rRNA pseudouridine746 synthase
MGIAFARREVHKRYIAVVHGRMPHEEGEIDLPLIADWPQRPRQKVDAVLGKPSLTRYRVLAYDDATDTSRVSLEPVTGRSHQLRVHLLAVGHTIVGDALYGEAPAGGRLMLHACELGLPHPVHGRGLELRSEAPF